jgi:antirestriction protein ArdC
MELAPGRPLMSRDNLDSMTIDNVSARPIDPDLGITPVARDDHAHYISSWLSILKADKKAIFTASSKAAQAVDYLDGLQPAETVDDADELEEAACGRPLSSFRLWKG